jgi:O-antigen ligase
VKISRPGVDRLRPTGESLARRGRLHQPGSWDLFLVAAAGLLLVGQARVQVFLPFPMQRPALLLGLLVLGVWLIQTNPLRSLHAVIKDPIGKAALLFVSAAVVGVPFSLSLGGSARFLLDMFSRTFLVFLIVAAAVRNVADVRRLMGTLAAGAAVFGLMAPISRGTRSGSIGGYDVNDAAMFLVSALPFLVFFLLYGRRLWVRLAAAASAISVLGVIVMTQSRGGFVALIAVTLFMVLMFKSVRPAARVGVIVLVVVASVPLTTSEYWNRMQTITSFDDGYGGSSGVGGRRNIWSRAIEYTIANPLTGVGINQFARAEGQHPLIRARIEAGIGTKYNVAHSMWFQALAELGLPGFMAFLALFALSARKLRRLQNATKDLTDGTAPGELQAMAGVLLASLVGVMVAGSFLSHAYSALTWGVLGIILGLSKVSTGGLRGSLPRRRVARMRGQAAPSQRLSTGLTIRSPRSG